LVRFLAAQGLQADISTDLAEVAGRAAERQARGHLRAVVAAGGDGTVAEIVNRVPAGVPVTVLPLGTENLLAKYLGIGREPESVGEAIASGVAVRLDAGLAVSPRGVWLGTDHSDRTGHAGEFLRDSHSRLGETRRHALTCHSEGSKEPHAVLPETLRCAQSDSQSDSRVQGDSLPGRIFLLMASCGLDADVVYRLEQARRGHISHLSYIKPIVSAFRSYGYPPLRIRCRPAEEPAGQSAAAEAASSSAGAACSAIDPVVARWMFLFNMPCYARGLPFTPGATGDDGLFDLCAFERGSFWHGMRYLMAVLRGKHDRLADCTLRRVTGLRVEADESVPFQLDGDFGGYLPLEVSLLPRWLTLVVPAAWPGTRPTILARHASEGEAGAPPA
jgi:diacylglycerol kinase family enzyme